LNLKFCENLNFITFDKLNINLGKTYAKLRIFPKIFLKIGPLVSKRSNTADIENKLGERLRSMMVLILRIWYTSVHSGKDDTNLPLIHP